MTTTRTDQPTWEALVRHAPRLTELRTDVEAVESSPRFCANRPWYGTGGFRDRMSDLVGWSAGSRFLATEAASDVAYDTLYDLLPDCRHEGWC